MKLTIAVCALALVHQASLAATGPTAARHDILTWSAMDPVQFGCYVEKNFGVRDARFNCSAPRYLASSDPCTAGDAYDEGPAFPRTAAGKIHPEIKSIDLSWERGSMQQISVVFKRKLGRKEIARILSLPEHFEVPQQKLKFMRIYIEQCSSDGTCLGIQMFDHMGAGDVDCGDAR